MSELYAADTAVPFICSSRIRSRSGMAFREHLIHTAALRLSRKLLAEVEGLSERSQVIVFSPAWMFTLSSGANVYYMKKKTDKSLVCSVHRGTFKLTVVFCT